MRLVLCLHFTVFLASISLGLVACNRSEPHMTNTPPNTPSSLPQTIIHFKGQQLTLTVEDAKQIEKALRTYLDRHGEDIKKILPPNLKEALPDDVGNAWIDPSGNIRIGPWLLEARSEELVLTYRAMPPTDQFGYQYVAHLCYDHHHWSVSSITYEKLLPRQRSG